MSNKKDIRPKKLENFIGKTKIIDSLKIGIKVAKKNNKPLDHTLFYGPPGVGKTSLAQIIANEMNVKIKIIQSSNIQILADLVSVLSSLKNNDVLFIDEIHSLKTHIGEILYPALEDNVLDIVIGKAYNTKIIRLQLPKFTLIAATTNFGLLSKALEERFGYIFFIDTYTDAEIKKIIKSSCKKLKIIANKELIKDVLENCRGIPRNCNRILKRISDYQSIGMKNSVKEAIKECGYIYKGITEIDMKYLIFLNKEKNKISGIKSLSQGLFLDEKTIENKIEPFLIHRQYISKLINGRQLTKIGEQILNEYQKN